mmetsp:Transcript_38724/g.78227  ORF Transcript_38724/g.78227 Transcript_38724/m.78227 type:complete len:247 (+) Transcript_38724:200-940(+)
MGASWHASNTESPSSTMRFTLCESSSTCSARSLISACLILMSRQISFRSPPNSSANPPSPGVGASGAPGCRGASAIGLSSCESAGMLACLLDSTSEAGAASGAADWLSSSVSSCSAVQSVWMTTSMSSVLSAIDGSSRSITHRSAVCSIDDAVIACTAGSRRAFLRAEAASWVDDTSASASSLVRPPACFSIDVAVGRSCRIASPSGVSWKRSSGFRLIAGSISSRNSSTAIRSLAAARCNAVRPS